MMIEFRDTGYGYLRDNSEEYVQIDLDDGAAILDGTFDIDHLEQIIIKMKELAGNTSNLQGDNKP